MALFNVMASRTGGRLFYNVIKDDVTVATGTLEMPGELSLPGEDGEFVMAWDGDSIRLGFGDLPPRAYEVNILFQGVFLWEKESVTVKGMTRL